MYSTVPVQYNTLGRHNLATHQRINLMKEALRETQTLRAGCSNTEPKEFAPPQTPFPGAWTAKI